jgi:hypothetical protein
MLMPISDTITSAERLLRPGMVRSISMASRKGSTLPSTSWSMRAMAASRASQHEAVMGRYPAAQRRLQFHPGGVEAPVSQFRQCLRSSLAGDQGLDQATAGEAKVTNAGRPQFLMNIQTGTMRV